MAEKKTGGKRKPSYLGVRIDPIVHNNFLAEAKREGTSARQLIEDFCRDYIAQVEKKRNRVKG